MLSSLGVAGCHLHCVTCSRVVVAQCRHLAPLGQRGLAPARPCRSSTSLPAVGVVGPAASSSWQPGGSTQQLSSKATAKATAGPTAGPTTGRKLCLIDGHNIAFRAFYGIFKSPMTALQTSDGIPTTVTFGFVRTLLALVEQEHPDAVVVVFDAPGGSLFRRELLHDYKANRVKPAPGFAEDLSNLKLLLQQLRMPTLSVPGYEADDVMAGLAAQAKGAGWRTLLVSTDKDLWQVVDDAGGVAVLPPSGSSSKSGRQQGAAQYIDEAAVQQTLGVTPGQVPDYKALMGDARDNIPGVPGVGPKTAAQLLQKHGDLDAVFVNAAGEKKGVAGKLAGRQEEAALYRDLATVRPEAAPAYDFDAARLQGFAAAEVEPLLQRLQMGSLLKDLPRMQRLLGGAAAPDPQRLAALPAALSQIAAAAASLQQGEGNQQPTSAAAPALQPGAVSSDQGAGGLDAGLSGSVSDMGVAAGADSSGAAPAAPPADVLAQVPAVQMVSTVQGLQALVSLLMSQQGLVTLSWPQPAPYSPGDRHQQPPAVMCCAWQPPPQQAGTIPPGSSSSSRSSTPQAGAPAAAAAAEAAATTQRRCRRTRLASTIQPQQQPPPPPQQQPPPLQSAHGMGAQPQPQPQPQQQQLQLALVLAGEQLPAAAMLATLQPFLQDSDHPKCMFESKRAFTELHHQGVQLAGVRSDVLVAGCLPDPQRWVEVLDPQRQQAAVLPAMAQHVLNTTLQDMADALQASAAAGGAAVQPQAWLAAAEAWATHLLERSFTAALQGLGDGGQLLQLLHTIEVPVQRVLSAMEVKGVRCDRQVLLEQRQQLQAEVDALEQQLFAIAQRRFNLDSPKECSAVIFDELGLGKGKGIKKTKSGYYSTSMSEIDKLEPSPFQAAFVEWSRLSSLLSKYYGSTYMGAINPDTGRIHTTYHQVGVATGRLASSNPNMQAVPAHDERGRMFRAAFTADEGHTLVAADYSQVELRVMAALSGDDALLQAFAAGQDVHAATAREVLGKGPEAPLTAEERQLGKRVNFSIVYGAGTRQLAGDLGMTTKQAQQFLDNFRAAHPKLYAYKTHCMRSAVARGYTLSAAGRRRVYTFSSPDLRSLRGRDLQQLPDMKELQKMAGRGDAHVLLQATNAPIQSSSADAMKAALIQLHDRLAGPPHHCSLLLTVHDDVLLEVPQAAWPGVEAGVRGVMQDALPPLVLKVDVAAGPTWMDCK